MHRSTNTAAIACNQGQLAFSDFDNQPGIRWLQSGKRLNSERALGRSDLNDLNQRDDLADRLLQIDRLSQDAANRLHAFSPVIQHSFEVRRIEDASHIMSHFSDAFSDFWNKRYTQYSSTDRFLKRVAGVFNLSIDQARATQQHLRLPSCGPTAVRCLDQTKFSTCLYLDEKEIVRDPLSRFYDRTVRKNSTLPAWDRYLSEYAFLTPEALEPSDIRFMLKNYPMPLERHAALLQLRPEELLAYADDMNFPVTYRQSRLNIAELLGHEKHARLTRIVLGCAHALYTHQAMPLRYIAERIGIDVTFLFTLGDRAIGDWVMPTLKTVHHVIEVTTLLHIESGGVLRRDVNAGK